MAKPILPIDLRHLRRRFDDVADTIARLLMAANSHVVALVAKWDRDDLVPGLSDLDFRVICDADARADDWVEIDRAVGRIHSNMVHARPEWNRINEHPIGAGLTLSELADDRLYNPECATWTLWAGETEWFDHMTQHLRARPFDVVDERYHLQRFLSYFSRYQHGIDPPINLGPFEPKYALHSRCWHYFAPPMYSAACLLARRSFTGKRQALQWLRDHDLAAPQVDAVLGQVDAHYETKELDTPGALTVFEEHLYKAFEALLAPVCAANQSLKINPAIPVTEMRALLSAAPADPLSVILESARFARIRAGRYAFYLNAPNHFDADWLLANETIWLKKLVLPVRCALGELAGDADRSIGGTLGSLGIDAVPDEVQLFERLVALSNDPALRDHPRRVLAELISNIPTYSRLLERILTAILRRSADDSPRRAQPASCEGVDADPFNRPDEVCHHGR